MRATVVAKTSSSPGINGLITFTIQRTLTFNAGATYKFELNSTNGKADEVAALGVGSTRPRSFRLARMPAACTRSAPF